MTKSMFANRSAVLLTITAVALLAFSAVPAFAQDGAPCSAATLNGKYIFDASGWINLGAGFVPKAVVEILDIHGDGTLSSVATANIAGFTPAHDHADSATYTVNADCTGTLTFTSNLHFDIFVASSGGEFHLIQTDSSNVLAGAARRVSRGGSN